MNTGKNKKGTHSLEEISESRRLIPITQRALDTIKGYAFLVGDSEIYGFLISPADRNDRVVREVMVAQNQTTSSASAALPPEAAFRAKQEIEERNAIALGFWHSHGSMGVFHSGVDDSNFAALLGAFGGNTERISHTIKPETVLLNEEEQSVHYISGKKEFIFYVKDLGEIKKTPCKNGILDDPRFPLCGISRKGDLILVDKTDAYEIPGVKSVTVHKALTRPFSAEGVGYSIVSNKRGEIYGEIGKTAWCSTCKKNETYFDKNVGLRILPSEESRGVDLMELSSHLETAVRGYRTQRTGVGSWMKNAMRGMHL